MSVLALILSSSVVFAPQPDISLEITENQDTSKTVFFAPHENEFVANEYLAEKICKDKGRFIILRQHGNRTIALTIEDKTFKVDPNRIYTPIGRQATLKKLNPTIRHDVRRMKLANERAELLSDFILQELASNGATTWIAMHNNTNGFDNDGNNGSGTISIHRYQKKLDSGAKFLIDVASGEHDEDDLYYLTERADFDSFKKDGWNLVLQNPIVMTDPSEDDGSLSVYAQMKGVRYINIEAERKAEFGGSDHFDEQKMMVDYVFEQLVNKQ
jgi:hypothetical protein